MYISQPARCQQVKHKMEIAAVPQLAMDSTSRKALSSLLSVLVQQTNTSDLSRKRIIQ